MRPLSKRAIDAARANSVWEFGNGVLYDLCRDHPAHVKDHEIIAKVWLIGRAYAAAIERRRNAERSDYFYEEAAAAIRKSGIDRWLAALPKGERGIPQSIAVHKRLTDLFKKITGLEKRSLASKYLHFHMPEVFYIYDSRAKWAISSLVPRQPELPAIATEPCDPEYKQHVRRCMWLRNNISSTYGVLLTPRQIDKLLLG